MRCNLIDDDPWSSVDSWTWKAEFEETDTTGKNSGDWLQTCLVSLSPQSEILVIANDNRYAVLSCMTNDEYMANLMAWLHTIIYSSIKYNYFCLAKWEKVDNEEFQKYQLVYPTSTSSSDLRLVVSTWYNIY